MLFGNVAQKLWLEVTFRSDVRAIKAKAIARRCHLLYSLLKVINGFRQSPKSEVRFFGDYRKVHSVLEFVANNTNVSKISNIFYNIL